MTKEDYIKTHPEQFKDDIDKWLFLEFGIIGGCCSAEKSHEYHIARMVAEKLNDVFIKNACDWLGKNLSKYSELTDEDEYGNKLNEVVMNIFYGQAVNDFKEYMKGA